MLLTADNCGFLAHHPVPLLVAVTTLFNIGGKMRILLISAAAAVFLSFLEFCNGANFFNTTTVRFLDSVFKLNKFARLETPQLIEYRGYPSETHRVVTPDGFILEMHRIPFGRSKWTTARGGRARIPVLMMHGAAQSSVDWVLSKNPSNCLGFVLADAGYDVWMGNYRGNTYSKWHLKHTIEDSAFWNFSGEEIGVYDFTSMIDYILELTGHPRLHFVGYSMATTSYFILMSQRPEYNEKIRLMVSLGTAVFQHRTKEFPIICAIGEPLLDFFQGLAGPFPLPDHWIAKIINTFIPHICNPKNLLMGFIPKICHLIWTVAWHPDGGRITKYDMPLLLAKLPTASSTKSFNHVCQNVNNRGFNRYDYGPKMNLRIYGRKRPPPYDLTRVTSPVQILYSPNDLANSPGDIGELLMALPNVVDFYRIPSLLFNHVDFTYAPDAYPLVYQRMLQIMRKFDY